MNPVKPDHDSEGVFRLIYRSKNRIPPENQKAELGILFSEARSKNKRLNVTGALLTSGDMFAQTLEGDEKVVRTLFDTIERDGRHEHISILYEGYVPERAFSRWVMARVSADGEPDIALIAHTDGISSAARRRGTTPEQESVLDIMRAATRGEAPAS
jgi:hypothetical protein